MKNVKQLKMQAQVNNPKISTCKKCQQYKQKTNQQHKHQLPRRVLFLFLLHFLFVCIYCFFSKRYLNDFFYSMKFVFLRKGKSTIRTEAIIKRLKLMHM
jgi:hypothetical protein